MLGCYQQLVYGLLSVSVHVLYRTSCQCCDLASFTSADKSSSRASVVRRQEVDIM